MGSSVRALAQISGLVRLSRLDSDRFGIGVARTTASLDLLPAVLLWCQKRGVKLLIARLHTPEKPSSIELHQLGFEHMDTLSHWTGDLSNFHGSRHVSRNITRLVGPRGADSIRKLARRAFQGYQGHYHRDRRLPNDLCNETYADWAYRFCVDESEQQATLVCESDGEIIGFTMIRQHTAREAEIVLSGVESEHRGQGVYRMLHKQRVLWCLRRNINRLKAATLSVNCTMEHCLRREGFMITHSTYTYHKWF